MPPDLRNVILTKTAEHTSSGLRVVNLTGKFINLPSLTLSPDGPAHSFSPYKAGSKTIGGVDITIFAFYHTPLPISQPNVIILLTEEMAKHYSDRSDVFFPVEDKTEVYHNGHAMRYSGLARYISSNSIGEASHPDGL